MANEPHLQELARRYRMTYRISPEWGTDEKWRQQKIGFEIEVHGSGPADSPDLLGDAEARARSQAALHEVAEWALAVATPEVAVAIDGDRSEVQLEPGGWAVTLTAHVLHAGRVRHGVDEQETEYVREVRRRLSSVGVHEG
jgi:hypothetical protein